jgi:hypothetical protein
LRIGEKYNKLRFADYVGATKLLLPNPCAGNELWGFAEVGTIWPDFRDRTVSKMMEVA